MSEFAAYGDGPDATALAVIQGPIVRELITWRGESLTESADRAIAHAERVWHEDGARRGYSAMQLAPTIWVDEPGLGGGVIDIMRKKGWPVRPFNGAAQPNDRQRFANARAESHWALRTLLENNVVAIPADAALEEEAISVEWQINAAGQIQMLSKDHIRAAIGRSPDRLDAVIIGLAQSVGGLQRVARQFIHRV